LSSGLFWQFSILAKKPIYAYIIARLSEIVNKGKIVKDRLLRPLEKKE
jgi:hypothetical protein